MGRGDRHTGRATGPTHDAGRTAPARSDDAAAAARLGALAEASKAFAMAGHDLRAVLDQLAQSLSLTLGDTCQVALLSDDGARLELAAVSSQDPELADVLKALDADPEARLDSSPVVLRVLRSGAPELIPLITAEEWRALIPPGRRALYERFPPHSTVVVALHARERILGVLSVTRFRRERPAFTVDDMLLAQDLADRAALALDGARLLDETRRNETRYRTLFDSAPVGIARFSADRRCLEANGAYCRMLGYSPAELVGLHATELVDPEGIAWHESAVRTLQGGSEFRGIRMLRRKDGEIVPVEATATASPDGSMIVIAKDITERMRGEFDREQLARVRERLAMAVRAAHLGSWEWDVVEDRLLWDDGMYELYGVQEQTFSGVFDAWVQCLHPEDRVRGEREVRQALAGSAEFDSEFRVAHPDGTVRHLRSRGAIIRDEAGKPRRMTGVNFDITDQKLANEAVRASEAQQRALLETSPVAISVCEVICDADGQPSDYRFLYVNPAYERFARTKAADLVGRTVYECFPQAERDIVERIGRVALTGAPGRYERFNSWLDLHYEATMYSPRPGQCVVFVVDVTERKRAEARLRRLIDSNAQGVMFWKGAGPIVRANDAFLDLAGYTRADLEAGLIDASAMTPPEYRDADQRAGELLRTRGTCPPYEKEFVRKDGTRVPVLMGGATFEDAPDEGVAWVVDLTERKQLEHQLFRAQRMESIGTLAGGIAHDLNNVLGPILGSLELLREGLASSADRELVETLEASTRRAAGLVRQVLQFARGVEGERVAIDPVHVVSELLEILRDTLPKSVEVTTHLPGERWTVSGDVGQLQQVLLNLCINARDAMPAGGTLSLRIDPIVLDDAAAALHVGARSGRYVRIQVADTGAGVSPAIVEQIFDPFFTTKSIGNGTGLGLSTAFSIVKSHGGFMNVVSEPGRGARFDVYLPATTAPAEVKKAPIESPHPQRGNGELILVVDDEQAIRRVVQRILERSGYRVLLAVHGAEALELYARHGAEIAVVLTDMTMPVMDGNTLAKALEARNPLVKIIRSSGLDLDFETAKSVANAVKRFVPKPYTADTLLEALWDVLHVHA